MLKCRRNSLMSTLQEQYFNNTNFLLHALLAFTKCLGIQTLTLFPLYYKTFIYFYILLLLLNSSCEMDLEFSIIIFLFFSCMALTVLLLYSVHPDGGFLTVSGDGVLFSKVGLALGFSTSTNSSPHSEELHQHLVSPD